MVEMVEPKRWVRTFSMVNPPLNLIVNCTSRCVFGWCVERCDMSRTPDGKRWEGKLTFQRRNPFVYFYNDVTGKETKWRMYEQVRFWTALKFLWFLFCRTKLVDVVKGK